MITFILITGLFLLLIGYCILMVGLLYVAWDMILNKELEAILAIFFAIGFSYLFIISFYSAVSSSG